MKTTDIPTFSFRRELARIRTRIDREASSHLIVRHDDSEQPIWQQHLSANSHFCRTLVANGYLTAEQMRRAARRYRLGMARDGGVIFWQIGLQEQVYDGKIMYYRDNCHRDHSHNPTWVSAELKNFYLDDDFPADCLPTTNHCLFGTHLLREDDTHAAEPDLPHPSTPVAVVEAEKTAIICSERYPDFLWLAPGGLEALTPEVLFPLRNRKIILFPDTDDTGETFGRWYQIAQRAQRLLGCPIRVSPILEQRATADQKRRKIDIADFLFEQ